MRFTSARVISSGKRRGDFGTVPLAVRFKVAGLLSDAPSGVTRDLEGIWVLTRSQSLNRIGCFLSKVSSYFPQQFVPLGAEEKLWEVGLTLCCAGRGDGKPVSIAPLRIGSLANRHRRTWAGTQVDKGGRL